MHVCILADINSIHARRWAEGLVAMGLKVTVISPRARRVKGAEHFFWPIRRVKRSLTVRIVEIFRRIPILLKLAHNYRFFPVNLVEVVQTINFTRTMDSETLLVSSIIRRKIEQSRPDVVHLHYLNHLAPMLAVSRRKLGCPLIVSVWGDDIEEQAVRHFRLNRLMRLAVLRNADHVTATSRYLAALTNRYTGGFVTPVIIPFGVDIHQFRPRASQKRKEILVGFIKYFLPGYGADIFIKAIPKILEGYPHARFLMVGAGDQLPFKKLARSLGIERRIKFSRAVSHRDMPRLIRSIDIYIMPSHFESFGVTALEAQACGVPVIASRVGGIPEIIIDGKNGLLFKPGDPSDLADKALALLLHDDLRKKYGETARKHVVRRFNWAESLRTMINLYEMDGR